MDKHASNYEGCCEEKRVNILEDATFHTMMVEQPAPTYEWCWYLNDDEYWAKSKRETQVHERCIIVNSSYDMVQKCLFVDWFSATHYCDNIETFKCKEPSSEHAMPNMTVPRDQSALLIIHPCLSISTSPKNGIEGPYGGEDAVNKAIPLHPVICSVMLVEFQIAWIEELDN